MHEALAVVLSGPYRNKEYRSGTCTRHNTLMRMRLGLHPAAAAAASPELLFQCPHTLCELLTHCSQVAAHNILTLSCSHRQDSKHSSMSDQRWSLAAGTVGDNEEATANNVQARKWAHSRMTANTHTMPRVCGNMA